MPDSPILSPAASVPIRGTLGALIRLIAAEWKAFLKIMLVPALLLAVLDYGIRLSQGEPIAKDPAPLSADSLPVAQIIYLILFLPFQAWMSVNLLRHLARGEAPVGWFPPLRPQTWDFWGSQILLTLVAVLPLLLSIFLPKVFFPWVQILAFCWFGVAFARLSPMTVAAALGTAGGVARIWLATRGQTLRLMGLRFLGSLLMLIPLLIAAVFLVLVGLLSQPVAFVLSSATVMMIQLTTMQSLDALIYAHFFEARDRADG